jgi:nitroreductase
MSKSQNLGAPDSFALFFKRKSIRNYADTFVEREKIMKIMEAVRWSPSAQNSQPWEFLIIDDQERKKDTVDHCGLNTNRSILNSAPVLIIGLANSKSSVKMHGIDYYLIDFAIAMEHLILAAAALDLGTCWMAWYNEKKLKKFLNIPEKMRIVAISPLGYPKNKKTFLDFVSSKIVAKSGKRKKIEKFLFFNEYGRTD